MELVYSFKFGGGYLFEVNNIDVSDSEPSKKYQWYFYEKNNLTKLIFDAMEENERYFKDGSCIDIENLFFTRYDTMYVLEKCSKKDNQQIFRLLKNLIHS